VCIRALFIAVGELIGELDKDSLMAFGDGNTGEGLEGFLLVLFHFKDTQLLDV